jgi:hypothetical protein
LENFARESEIQAGCSSSFLTYYALLGTSEKLGRQERKRRVPAALGLTYRLGALSCCHGRLQYPENPAQSPAKVDSKDGRAL